MGEDGAGIRLMLEVRCGETRARRVMLDGFPEGNVTFGRRGDRSIVLDSPTVSREHGQFFMSQGSWYVADSGSTHGTSVNGRRLENRPHKLQPGDQIALGQGGSRVEIAVCAAGGAGPGPEGTELFKPEQSAAQAQGEARPIGGTLELMLLDGTERVEQLSVDTGTDAIFTFGRSPDNQIVLDSPVVSKQHGAILIRQGRCYLTVCGGNGVLLNGRLLRHTAGENMIQYPVNSGDILRIDARDRAKADARGVMIAFSAGGGGEWKTLQLYPDRPVTIGRAPDNTVSLSHVGVSRHHARIVCSGGAYYIEDSSTNGTLLDGRPVAGRARLYERSCIAITTTRLYYVGGRLIYAENVKGLALETRLLTRDVKEAGKTRRILNKVSLRIAPQEFVAIVGGSGCGKSTLMNAMSGYDRATEGSVYINNESLYRNYDYFKNIMGYVPQQDIVHEHLTLERMLEYTARLRMPEDTSAEERRRRVREVLETVELREFGDTLVRKLSGGQRKRASIAVELLADPGLFFLDEPTSGLDPGTERNLMHMLKTLSQQKHKTVIMVTHTTLNLHLCDKIVFMGKGGRLCFFGGPEEAKRFFGVDNFVDIYNLINADTSKWAEEFAQYSAQSQGTGETVAKPHSIPRPSFFKQLRVLSERYLNLLCNDRARLGILLAEPVILALVLKLCTGADLYVKYGDTKNMLFTFTCCAIWIGIFNAIQEICKERVILKREYMANLRLPAYICSKVLVQSLLCFIQACMLLFVYAALTQMPETSVWDAWPGWEMLITTFLTILSSAAMGLAVSAFSKNADRAMSVSPFLLVIQLVFAGVIFKLEGAVKLISNVTISRWAIAAYGSTADLKTLYDDFAVKQEEVYSLLQETFQRDATIDMFEATTENLYTSWLVLLGFVALFCLAACVILRKVSKDSR